MMNLAIMDEYIEMSEDFYEAEPIEKIELFPETETFIATLTVLMAEWGKEHR